MLLRRVLSRIYILIRDYLFKIADWCILIRSSAYAMATDRTATVRACNPIPKTPAPKVPTQTNKPLTSQPKTTTAPANP